MLRLLAVAAVVGACFWATTASAVLQTGRLAGRTQISFGCPGPLPESGTCNPWRTFPFARFSIARRAADGSAVPGTTRYVRSNERGRFVLQLAVGRYLVTPLKQQNTRGGDRLTARVYADATTTILVRFIGVPQMQ